MIANSWTIRSAEVSDAGDITSIIRSAFAPQLLDLFVYGCPGIERFIAEGIRVQNLGGDADYTVATADGKVVACAEVRRMPNRLFLNYVAVRDSHRSQGLGKQLLRKALVDNNRTDAREVVLDVLETNTDVFHWYERLGFQHQDTITWRQCPLEGGSPAPLIVSGYAQAQASQREFGFSRFTIRAGEHSYEIGQLGTRWFRLTNPDALTTPGVLAGLRALSPQRRILLLSGTDSINTPLLGRRNLPERSASSPPGRS